MDVESGLTQHVCCPDDDQEFIAGKIKDKTGDLPGKNVCNHSYQQGRSANEDQRCAERDFLRFLFSVAVIVDDALHQGGRETLSHDNREDSEKDQEQFDRAVVRGRQVKRIDG